MKQVSQDKYSIAWFKLSECVARGEKERAMGVYRLLSHSIHDKALVYQLEGDLLLAFKDPEAADRYYQAAQRYSQDGRLLQSAAMYEHMIYLDPQKEIYYLRLIDIYEQLGKPERKNDYIYALSLMNIKNTEWLKAIEWTNSYQASIAKKIMLHEQLITAFLDCHIPIGKELFIQQMHNLKELSRDEDGKAVFDILMSRLEVEFPELYGQVK